MKKDKLNVNKLFTSEKSSKKTTDETINYHKGSNKKSLESLRQDLSLIDTKLLPIEDEFKYNRLCKQVKTVFESKSFSVKIMNLILFGLILIFLYLNIIKFLDKNDYLFSSTYYKSPIESILPEENIKERVFYN